MAFEKASIYVVGKNSGKSYIDVLFNPKEYSLKHENSFTEYTNSKNVTHKYNCSNPNKLEMTLFFDTTETRESVKKKYVDKLNKLLDTSINKEPTICKFVWGEFSFIGIINSIEQKYTMFLESGEPVRASVDVRFISYDSKKKR